MQPKIDPLTISVKTDCTKLSPKLIDSHQIQAAATAMQITVLLMTLICIVDALA
jgi:hypothetical protein